MIKREEIQEQQLIINFDSAKSQNEILVNSPRLSAEQSSEAQNSDEKQSGEDDKQFVVVENTEEKDSSKRFEAAQIQLCRYFNEKEIRLANGKRLLSDVGSIPTKIVQ